MTTGAVPNTSRLYPFFNGDGCLGTKGFVFSFPSVSAEAPLAITKWVFRGGAAALAKMGLTRFPTREWSSTFSLIVVVFLAKIASLPIYPVVSGRASWISCRAGEAEINVDDESWECCRASRCKATVSDFSPSPLMLVTYNEFSNNQRRYNDTDHSFRISLSGVAGLTTTGEGEPSQGRVDAVRDSYSSQHN